MIRDYYMTLGVASDASADEIKAAFRRRALDFHPDTSRLESGPFLEIQEAYGVLADPEQRQRYDQQSRPQPPAPRPPWRSPRESLRTPRLKAEPLRPVEPASGFRKVSLTDSFASYRPSFDELFDRWWSNFRSVTRPKAEMLKNLTVEVLASPEEALFGGTVRVGIPAQAVCRACGGHGAVGLYECWRCEGHGALTAEYPVDIEYPPLLPSGYTVKIPLARFGIENFYLTVLFRVTSG